MIAQPVTCRCGEELLLMVDLAHGRDVSFCLACVGARSCGYASNRITLDNPTDVELSLATELLITSLRSTTPAPIANQRRRVA